MAKNPSGGRAFARIAISLALSTAALAAPIPAFAADTIPNFAPNADIAWVAFGQDNRPPPSGPGPVVGDPAREPKPGQPAFRVADLSNPMLQSWTREELRKANARALSGKVAYTPKERCWPNGVPGFDTYPVQPVYFLQTPRKFS
jgi:hypothetical protein